MPLHPSDKSWFSKEYKHNLIFTILPFAMVTFFSICTAIWVRRRYPLSKTSTESRTLGTCVLFLSCAACVGFQCFVLMGNTRFQSSFLTIHENMFHQLSGSNTTAHELTDHVQQLVTLQDLPAVDMERTLDFVNRWRCDIEVNLYHLRTFAHFEKVRNILLESFSFSTFIICVMVFSSLFYSDLWLALIHVVTIGWFIACLLWLLSGVHMVVRQVSSDFCHTFNAISSNMTQPTGLSYIYSCTKPEQQLMVDVIECSRAQNSSSIAQDVVVTLQELSNCAQLIHAIEPDQCQQLQSGADFLAISFLFHTITFQFLIWTTCKIFPKFIPTGWKILKTHKSFSALEENYVRE
eukprot:c8274_g1_i1.p1 GENE.c8274_g1_i1~~c8274_g1_i1.p1  ORF type:complete len:358 (+),score=54.78 c8274_g1_i1:26-1075(+)